MFLRNLFVLELHIQIFQLVGLFEFKKLHEVDSGGRICIHDHENFVDIWLFYDTINQLDNHGQKSVEIYLKLHLIFQFFKFVSIASNMN